MSNDLNNLIEKPAKTDLLRKFYELVVSGQYSAALSIADNQADFGDESEKVVIEVLRLKLGIQKYVG